jgi:hypothetical protein
MGRDNGFLRLMAVPEAKGRPQGQAGVRRRPDAILRKNLPTMSEDLAQKSYDILAHPTSGFARRAELDVAGIRMVLALRSKYAKPAKQLTDPAKYYDLQYYAKAR